MSILNENNTLILIIDIQEKLLNAIYNKEIVKNKSIIIAKAASYLNIPVIATEQYPKGLGATNSELKSSLNNNTKFLEKTSFSAIDHSAILNAIESFGRKQIVLFGIETHICVSQTAAALIGKGYDVTLIKDCSGSRLEYEHLAGIERMKTNGVQVITTEIALFEWLRDARHIKFKQVQELIK